MHSPEKNDRLTRLFWRSAQKEAALGFATPHSVARIGVRVGLDISEIGKGIR